MSDDQREISDLLTIRREKLEQLEADGFAWPDRYQTTVSLNGFSRIAEGTEEVKIAGRVTALRQFGKLTFGRLTDALGDVQFALQSGTLGDDYAKALGAIDRGDHVGLSGTVMVTRTGEKTLDVHDWRLLSKSIRPLPEKYHGVTDIELRMRRRYLELVMDRDSTNRYLKRSLIFRYLRKFLEENDFIEIDTPILCSSASGAIAKPFITEYDALGMPAYLRIAPETYLKRAVAGGFNRVFEFARCFRNEGIDPSHLPDFTMLEFYAAYWNFHDMLDFTKSMLEDCIERLVAESPVESNDVSIDFESEWRVVSMRDLLVEYAGIDIQTSNDSESLRAEIDRRKEEFRWIDEIKGTPGVAYGNLVDLLFKKSCRPHLLRPTFVTNHPVELSPLARRSDIESGTVDRFQLVIGGWELVNAYSELVNPVDQRNRLVEQAKLRAEGDDEAMHLDEDFITCMEYGMPPMSGFGMGIDRLVALLTGVENLRDVTLFPLLKPE